MSQLLPRHVISANRQIVECAVVLPLRCYKLWGRFTNHTSQDNLYEIVSTKILMKYILELRYPIAAQFLKRDGG